MSDDESGEPSKLEKLIVNTVVGAGAEVAGWAVGVPGIGAATNALVMGMYDLRRQRVGDFFLRVARLLGGEDKLTAAVEHNPEREQLLYDSAQAVMASQLGSKHRYLAEVAARAMAGGEKAVWNAGLIVAALKELEGIHIAALTRIEAAYARNLANQTHNDAVLQTALEAEESPVLAALVRTGVVFVGSEQRGEDGLYSIPRARTYSITGVNQFGRDLLANLRSVDLD